uniref:Uncharacterized protein n=1 Tax=Arundo donax TaxID=35708 RepID=A0A0A8YNE1_ARUDO
MPLTTTCDPTASPGAMLSSAQSPTASQKIRPLPWNSSMPAGCCNFFRERECLLLHWMPSFSL